MKKTLLILVSIFLAGCAYNQRLDLFQGEAVHFSEKVIIDDLRDEGSKKFRTAGGRKSCQRWYGDAFIKPSKMDYLHGILSQKYQGDTDLHLEVKQFDTVEYCDGMIVRVQQTSSKVIGNLGVALAQRATGNERPLVAKNLDTDPVTPVASVIEKDGEWELYGDLVLIEIAGRVNGVDFEASRIFDYSDTRYIDFPAESPEYSERMRIALNEITDEILARIGTPDAQEDLEEID